MQTAFSNKPQIQKSITFANKFLFTDLMSHDTRKQKLLCFSQLEFYKAEMFNFKQYINIICIYFENRVI